MTINLGDYNDVASRIAEFRDKHPQGSLQSVNPAEPFRIVTMGDRTFVCYAAAAYRAPDDQRPGIGVAWEPVPGRTPYTRDSELQNAETSAWGRAIVAALAADTKKGIASREELQGRDQTDASVVSQGPRRKGSTQGGRGRSGGAKTTPPGVEPETGEIQPAIPSTEAQRADIAALAGETNYDLAAVLAKKQMASLAELTFEQAESLIAFLDKQRSGGGA